MSVNVLFLIDLVTYVQNILQPSFVYHLDVVGHSHLPLLPKPKSGVASVRKPEKNIRDETSGLSA